MTYCPLDLVENYLRRFVAYPSEHALVAHVLWIAHCHMFERFDTTPRLAFMSAEKESGKSRALEVTALFVPEPVLSISASPAVIVRLISRSHWLADSYMPVSWSEGSSPHAGNTATMKRAAFKAFIASNRKLRPRRRLKPTLRLVASNPPRARQTFGETA